MIEKNTASRPEESRLPDRRRGCADQITSPARTILLVLLAASALIFVIACSNVANLILARQSARRRAGDSRGARRRHGGAAPDAARGEPAVVRRGAALGVLIARPMVSVLARYASRYPSARSTSPSMPRCSGSASPGADRVGAAGIRAAAPSSDTANGGVGLSNGSVRMTSGTNRRLRAFAVTQIAASFVLLAGAGALVTTCSRCSVRIPA